MEDKTLQLVRSALSGREVHSITDPDLMESAVLLLLYPKDGNYCVLFNKRSEEVEFNKGEMCFPGGSRDPEDADLEVTARREAFEEMGVKVEDITIFGELDGTTTRAGFSIHPYVGTIPYPYDFVPSPAEVAAVVEVPLTHLFDDRNIRDQTRVMPDGTSTNARSYAYGPHLIYGATARILQQFLELLKGAGWSEEAVRS